MAKKSDKNPLAQAGIKPGEQVPLHVTNRQLRAMPKRAKSEAQAVYDQMPLDEKIKTTKGKRKPKVLR